MNTIETMEPSKNVPSLLLRFRDEVEETFIAYRVLLRRFLQGGLSLSRPPFTLRPTFLPFFKVIVNDGGAFETL